LHNKWIEYIPKTGDLTQWAKQGILLFNTSLTTQIGKPNAHKKIWKRYTDLLLANLSNYKFNKPSKQPLIFMLWGNHAKSKSQLLNQKCIILKWVHPSPLAQHKQSFIDCDHFDIANRHYKDSLINWNVEHRHDLVSERFGMNERRIVVFTDGSCNPNKLCKEAIAGYAACIVLGNLTNMIIYGNIENNIHYASNQRAEGIAIYRLLLYLNTRLDDWDECIIVSDSKFWISMIEIYMPNWSARKIDFHEKKNSDLTIALFRIYNKLIIKDMKMIEFRHMRSHNKSNLKNSKNEYDAFCYEHNNFADEFAKYARLSLKPGTHIIESVE